MSRIPPLDPSRADPAVQALLEDVNRSLGAVPKLFRVAARSHAALQGLLSLLAAVSGGQLGAKTRERVALAVAEANGCDYCLSAHTALGKGAGLTADDIGRARRGQSDSPKEDALLALARALVTERGRIGAAGFDRARAAGASDAEILETIATVVLNIFTNYINLVAETEIDFPVVRAGEPATA